ncbi:MAG: hypothetical protein ABJZ69_13100 [Hyphomicrobiales bacterium]
MSAILLCTSMAMPTIASAQDGNKAAAQSIEAAISNSSSSIRFVDTAGEWKAQNGNAGTHRVVLMEKDKNKQQLFIQWIPSGKSGKNQTPYTLEIPEVAKLKQKIIDVSSHSDLEGQLNVFLETETNNDPNLPYGYELFLTGRNDYTFSVAASN